MVPAHQRWLWVRLWFATLMGSMLAIWLAGSSLGVVWAQGNQPFIGPVLPSDSPVQIDPVQIDPVQIDPVQIDPFR
ncbi:MAG: hypothetical protein HC924_09030, partial [Synechococcaceae cyanobacterium SM2_3_2]|nr:hypothetical protein [Synechococcaceae cyanobacterium SM2_3_2]